MGLNAYIGEESILLGREKMLRYLIRSFLKFKSFEENGLLFVENQPSKVVHDFALNLNGYPTEKLLSLYDEEKQQELLENALMGLELDKYRFFNRPDCIADFIHNLRLKTWEKEQVLALSFGKDPNKIDWNLLNSYRENFLKKEPCSESPFINQYARLRDILLSDLSITNISSPQDFLRWFNNNQIIVHPNLQRTSVALGFMTDEEYKWINTVVPTSFLDKDSEASGVKNFSLEDTDYGIKLNNYCSIIMDKYPEWRKEKRIIQKTGNLKHFITETLPDITTREVSLVIDFLSEHLT